MIGRASFALAAYFLLTLAATWPLATGLSRDVAWDLGDSLLNMWILAWDAEQFRAILQGDFTRVRSFFDANIFHPAPLTLAYSEHLIPQAVQIFPIYLLTENPILCYNLLFLSTFVLSGFGMYLFVRELTGSAWAAFVAGLVFAFAPYRIAQSPHLQVLSSQWMPLALYGLRRYFDTGRIGALAGGAGAIVAQGLSSGYYLLYFTPLAAAYAVWEAVQRRRGRDRRMWLQLSAAGAAAILLIAPFLLPYAAIRGTGLARPVTEIAGYSADVYAYATAPPSQRLWGDRIQMFPRAEGELFPGFAALLLALTGLAAAARGTVAAADRAPQSRGRLWLARAFAVLAAVHAIAALATIIDRRITIDLWLFTLQMSDVTQLLLRSAIAFALLLAVSPAARGRTALFMRGPGFFLAVLLTAVWLSFGPSPQALGRPLDLAAPYRFLLENVPGFDGVRVPARFGMIVCLMLAVLAGFGAAALLRARRGAVVLAIAGLFVVLEGTAAPFVVNAGSVPPGYAALEPRVRRPARAPGVYLEFARQAPDAVLAELPLGETDFDLRAVYYSTAHWRRILNGYSGFIAPHYGQLQFLLNDLPRHPELSLSALRDAGATHVIVHEGVFLNGEGAAISAALTALGAVELYRDGGDVLLELPTP